MRVIILCESLVVNKEVGLSMEFFSVVIIFRNDCKKRKEVKRR